MTEDKQRFEVENRLEAMLKHFCKNPNLFSDKQAQNRYIDVCLILFERKGYNRFKEYILKFQRYRKSKTSIDYKDYGASL